MRKPASKIVTSGRMWAYVAALVACFTSASGASADFVTATKIGNPLYAPTGFALFSAPIDDGSSTYAVYPQTIAKVLPAPLWVSNPSNGNIGPGSAESPINPNDIINGVAANHYKSGITFNTTDFSNGNSIILGFLMIPTAGAPTGLSPDSANGPIIPNSLYLMHQTGDTSRNGVEFDPNWDYEFADVNNVLSGLGRPTYAGFSRMPFFEAETLEFGPGGVPATGSYASIFHLRDTAGNGWDISTSYAVVAVPEPASLAVAAAVGLLLLPSRRHRARPAAKSL